MELASRVTIRDAVTRLGAQHVEIFWDTAVSEPDLRLILTREKFLRTGVNGEKARPTATVLPVECLTQAWFRDRIIGSRARIMALGLAEGSFVVVAYDDTFDLFPEDSFFRFAPCE